KVSEYQTERVLIPDLLQASPGQSLLLGAVLSGNVAEGDLRVGRLFRGVDPGQLVDARVRHAHGTQPHLSAITNRHIEAGHGVEHRRLAGSGESYESDLHAMSSALRVRDIRFGPRFR